MSNSDYFSKIAADYDAVFNLIDVVFSLESCLRYQVLPLELFEDHLVLGMIDPKDREAVKFVMPIVQSLGYSFHIQAIDTQTHQLVLAAYLKSSPKDSSKDKSDPPKKQVTLSTLVEQNSAKTEEKQGVYDSPTVVELPKEANFVPTNNNSPTIVDIPEPDKRQDNNYDSATLVDSSPNLNLKNNASNSPTVIDLPKEDKNAQTFHEFPNLLNIQNRQVENQNDSATLFDIPEDKPEEEETEEAIRRKKKKDFKQTVFLNQSSQPEQLQILSSTPQINNLQAHQEQESEKDERFNPTILETEPEKSEPSLQLSDYSPQVLWQELLTKIVSGEVDKLYFQQHENYGSISCSQDGAVEPLLEQVASPIFKEIIKEIKVMAKLPLTTLDKHRKIAIPRLYKEERVLLRAEFFPSKFGEEITMQVFQGEALKFYEQRQADRTIEQAINLGQKLEKALNKMMVYQNSSIEMGDLSTLSSIVGQIEQKLRSLDS